MYVRKLCIIKLYEDKVCMGSVGNEKKSPSKIWRPLNRFYPSVNQRGMNHHRRCDHTTARLIELNQNQ